jgi:hypothetical protein
MNTLEQIKRTIAVTHSKNMEYKTAIRGSADHFYLVVTRVNYLTAQLWLDRRHKIITGITKGFTELPKKPHWLVMNRHFRREEDKRILELQKTTTPLWPIK